MKSRWDDGWGSDEYGLVVWDTMDLRFRVEGEELVGGELFISVYDHHINDNLIHFFTIPVGWTRDPIIRLDTDTVNTIMDTVETFVDKTYNAPVAQ